MLTIPSGPMMPMMSMMRSISLLGSLRTAFRDAGTSLLTGSAPQEVVAQQARERIGGILDGCQLSDQERDQLAYPLRASQRFLGGEPYNLTRLCALERYFLKKESYLRGVNDSRLRMPDLNQTIPSPPFTGPLSFEDCRTLIETSGGEIANLPEELQFIDLTGQDIRQVKVHGHAVAGTVLDLPMMTVFDAIFSREFDIGKNVGDFPGFWAEDVKIAASRKPSARISCKLASIDELRVFVIAAQTMLNLPETIEIMLEGSFEWRGEALYVPMRPVRFSGGIIPPDTLFGTATPILVPIGRNKTVFAIDLEDKLLSKNPEIFIKGMTSGMTKASAGT